jgi:L-threonylcarbamoyladenylate synthase
MTAMAGAAEIARAVEVLRAGGLVAFPTETVYGLGADARNPDALRAVYRLKGRPSSHPLIVHLASADQLGEWSSEVPPVASALAERFWPGPLTLVLNRAASVPDEVTGGQDTVALRVPAHPVARALLEAFGGGIAAPSANRYGRVSPTRSAHVLAEFGAEAPLVLEGGDCQVGLESTIVACLGGRVVLLRPGAITISQLREVTGTVDAPSGPTPRAPGDQASHYAPATPVRIVAAGAGSPDGAWEGLAVLARRPPPPGCKALAWRRLPDDAAAYGRELYAALRDLDQVGAGQILVEAVPSGEDWAAVADRLARAAFSVA